MDNLTKKDKLMLYALGLVVLIFIMFKLAISPMADSLMEINEKIDEAQGQKQTMQLTIAGHAAAQAQLEATKTEFKQLQSRLYPYMNPDEIDEMITSSLISYNLVPQKADIEEAESIIIEPYFASQLGIELTKKLESSSGTTTNDADSIDIASTSSSSGTAEQTPNQYVLVSPITYTAAGEPADFYRFMDWVASEEALRVTGFDISYSLRNRMVGSPTISISMNVYMYKPDSLVE